MKRILMILCVMLLLFTTSCSSNEEAENTVVEEPVEEVEVSNEVTLTGTLTEQYVIDTKEDFILTLNNVTASMEDSVIKVENAKSVTIILEGENTLESTGDATTVDPKVISSNADLIIKGDGVLNIKSTATGIKSKANLTIESGTYNFECGTDGNGLRADNTLTIEGGTFNISAGECLEATYININGGDFNLTSTDDAINASNKIDETDTSIVPVFTMNSGNIVITMEQGDTDGIDSNGDIVINGGKINVTGQSGFDWDGDLTFNDGEVFVNGQAVTEIQNQFGEMGQGMGFQDNGMNLGGPGMPGPMNGQEPPMGEDGRPKKPEGENGN